MVSFAFTFVFFLLFFPQQTPPRPQTPSPPFPYQVREALYTNPADNTTHGGTLTIPAHKGRHPAVLLLPGSGPVDRDETMLPGHKPFWVIADYLTRRGIAVLRVDDRGIGKSTGDYAAATGDVLAQDALAAIAWLKQQSEIDASRIGLIGHSQGGIVAPLVAAKTQDVAFVVLLAAPVLPDRENSPLRIRSQMRNDGKAEAEIAKAQAAYRLLREQTLAGANDETLRTTMRELARATYPLGPLSEKDLNALVDGQLPRMRSASVRYFMEHDPRAALRNLRVPALALQGSLDQAVAPRENLDELRKLWREAGNQEATIIELYGLNHLFQTVATGHPSEMMQSAETFSPQALELLAAWLRARTKLELAEVSPVAAEVERLNESWNRAWLEKDVAQVERLTTEDYVYLAPNGQTLDRQAILNIIRSPGYRLSRGTWTEVTSKPVAKGAALVTYRWQGTVSYEGRSFEEDHRCTRLVVQREGAWKVLSEHCSPNKP